MTALNTFWIANYFFQTWERIILHTHTQTHTHRDRVLRDVTAGRQLLRTILVQRATCWLWGYKDKQVYCTSWFSLYKESFCVARHMVCMWRWLIKAVWLSFRESLLYNMKIIEDGCVYKPIFPPSPPTRNYSPTIWYFGKIYINTLEKWNTAVVVVVVGGTFRVQHSGKEIRVGPLTQSDSAEHECLPSARSLHLAMNSTWPSAID